VVGVAKNAVNAEHQAQAAAQATATESDRQRTALNAIPLPTKSMYMDVHEPGAWANPFLSVNADTLNLRITLADANPSTVGQGTMLRPEAARRQEIQVRPGELVTIEGTACTSVQLLEPIGNIPPAEAEAQFYASLNQAAIAA